uniref:Uncharacterized protein n=1 Tax=viral metagenome TaxID=1070528 RepID=A0A6C0HY26_9ZZZZ
MDGTIVEINKCDYKNDDIYYTKIMEALAKEPTSVKPNSKDSYSTQAIDRLLHLFLI